MAYNRLAKMYKNLSDPRNYWTISTHAKLESLEQSENIYNLAPCVQTKKHEFNGFYYLCQMQLITIKTEKRTRMVCAPE